jgi:hypothetical protein
MNATLRTAVLPLALVIGLPPGEKLPKGPPWHVTHAAAKRDALRHGKPVFVYFTKTY